MRRAISILSELRDPMGEYLARSWHYWWLICVVGVVGLVGLAITILPGLEALIPIWAWILIGLLGIPIAQFLAFREIRGQRDAIADEHDQARHERDQARKERDAAQKELTEAKAAAARLTIGPAVSFGQRGGQTAGLIQNIGKQARRLPNDVQGMVARLSRFAGTKVDISFAMNDAECHQLATAIRDVLIQAGWVTGELSDTLWAPPVIGIHVNGPGETNPMDQFDPAMRELGNCLMGGGIQAGAYASESRQLLIGTIP